MAKISQYEMLYNMPTPIPASSHIERIMKNALHVNFSSLFQSGSSLH